MAELYKNYINGVWVGSSDGKSFEQRNPANLDEVTGLYPLATRDDARRAIDCARTAFTEWSELTAYRRAEYLKKALEVMIRRAEEVAAVITLENGKPLGDSRAEVDSAIKEMEFQIHEGVRAGGKTMPSWRQGVMAYSVRRPLGVVSVISPWNFPFNVPCRKITPALMAGNTVVFKPASLTPRTGLLFTQIYEEAGLPAGVLNFVCGGGSTVGEEFTTNPHIKAISFTGSTAVGQSIHRKAATIMAKTQLEMGGKNPMLVLEDADLNLAATDAVKAAYACAGQWCTSTSRVVVVKDVAKQFVSKVLELVSTFKVGDGRDESVTMGPVCGTEQVEVVGGYIKKGIAEGATLAIGGGVPKGLPRGCFFEPTVFTGVTPQMTIAREEIFGPVLSIIEADDFDHALRIANAIEFGLASSIYTNDLSRAHTFLEKTDVGLTHVNLMTAVKEPQLSFGGVKASGFGTPEAGETGIEFFTEHKVAYIKYR